MFDTLATIHILSHKYFTKSWAAEIAGSNDSASKTSAKTGPPVELFTKAATYTVGMTAGQTIEVLVAELRRTQLLSVGDILVVEDGPLAGRYLVEQEPPPAPAIRKF